jgi:hypothetical protein
MPGSLARPPQHEHRDKGEEIELTGELAVKRGRRSWRQHRWRNHGCGREATVQRLRRRGAASCSRPRGQAQHLGATSGLQACRPTDEATKVPLQAPRGGGRSSSEASRSRSSLEGKIHWAKLGGDGDERRRGRRIPTVIWKHSTRRSDCPIGRRQSSSELAGIGRGSRRRFEIARED